MAGRPDDARFMQAALAMARRALGRTAPNPPVGCVVVQGMRLVGRGHTQPGGRPHAERMALDQAGAAAGGATVYVTLEPCCHTGGTPPCADALVAAGVTRVVAATLDPDPRVSGAGMARLRRNGIETEVGVEAAAARHIMAGHFHRLERGRPFVSLKLATSLEGNIATRGGHSQWITGAAAREAGHRLRATHDAILVGSGTVIADNPQLTCRLPGLADQSPLRIVVDRRLRLPLTSRIVAEAGNVGSWVITLVGAPGNRIEALRACGLKVLVLPPGEGGIPDLEVALRRLAGEGVTSILVEGGQKLATAFLRGRLVDRIYWFRSAGLLGGDGLSAVGPLEVSKLADQHRWRRSELQLWGKDLLEILSPDP